MWDNGDKISNLQVHFDACGGLQSRKSLLYFSKKFFSVATNTTLVDFKLVSGENLDSKMCHQRKHDRNVDKNVSEL